MAAFGLYSIKPFNYEQVSNVISCLIGFLDYSTIKKQLGTDQKFNKF